jgi:ribosome production factor 1
MLFRPPEKVAPQEIGLRYTLKLRSLKKNIPAGYNLGEGPATPTIPKDENEDDPVRERESQVEEDEKKDEEENKLSGFRDAVRRRSTASKDIG